MIDEAEYFKHHDSDSFNYPYVQRRSKLKTTVPLRINDTSLHSINNSGYKFDKIKLNY